MFTWPHLNAQGRGGGGLGELETVMQTQDAVESLQTVENSSNSPSSFVA